MAKFWTESEVQISWAKTKWSLNQTNNGKTTPRMVTIFVINYENKPLYACLSLKYFITLVTSIKAYVLAVITCCTLFIIFIWSKRKYAPCGSGSCRIDPLRFLAGWHKRRLNQVLVSFGLVCVYVCSFYRSFRFFELTVFGCSLIQFC